MESPATPLRVFLSSTSVDLGGDRQRVASLIQSMGQFAVIMDNFALRPHLDATGVSLHELKASHIYVLMIAWRYGFIPEGSKLSVTHQEYREARRLGLPCFVFLADPSTDADLSITARYPTSVRDSEHRTELESFRSEVMSAQLVQFFRSTDDLVDKMVAALHAFLLDRETERFVRDQHVPHTLPPAVPSFVGRSRELATLCDTLLSTPNDGLAMVIWGMPGVGKSALAAQTVIELAHRVPTPFPGGITWMRCDNRTGWDGLAWMYDQLLDEWGAPLSAKDGALLAGMTVEAGVSFRERAFKRHLTFSTHSNVVMSSSSLADALPDGEETMRPALQQQPPRALVWLDNVEPDLHLSKVCASLLPLGITLLITSRYAPSTSQAALLQLDVLTAEPACNLLIERYQSRSLALPQSGLTQAGSRVEPGAAEVAKLLGYLPLAIELAAARASRTPAGILSVAAELRTAERLGILRDPLDPSRSVRYAFEQSIALLSLSQQARYVALGLLAGSDWPKKVIDGFLAEMSRGDPVSDDIDAFASLALVDLVLDSNGTEVRVRLHPLLRELVQDLWRKQPMTLRNNTLTGLLRQLKLFINTAMTDFTAMAREEDLIAGALRQAAHDPSAQRQIIGIVDALHKYFYVGGHWQVGVELRHIQLDACRRTHDRRAEAIALNNLALLYHAQGNYDEALTHYNRALAVRGEVGDKRGEGITLSSLGYLAFDQEKYEEATVYHERALRIRREVGDRKGEGISLGNLGLIAQTEGHYEAATSYLEQALSITREICDRRGEGITLGNLGLLAKSRKNYAEAANYISLSMAIRQEIGDRPGVGEELRELAEIVQAQGNYHDAIRYYHEAVAILRGVGDRQVEAVALRGLARTLRSLGLTREAALYYVQAVQLLSAVGPSRLLDATRQEHASLMSEDVT